MAHPKVTVSLVVEVAVIIVILSLPDVVVVCVTPPEKVAEIPAAYFKITTPEPPEPPT